MPLVGSFWHFVICCICVFVYVYFVFASLKHGNKIFDILEQSYFQKYATCWVFLALSHMLYLCICVFCICLCLSLCIRHHHMIEDIALFPSIFHMWCFDPGMIYRAVQLIHIFLAYGHRTGGWTLSTGQRCSKRSSRT